jgi:acetyl-CoA carboxylase biotin carboxyl carrier protein
MQEIKIKAEVTGSVWKIEKQIGDAIESGDTLMIIESMKMEIPVISEDAGSLSQLLVKEGDAVSEGGVVAIVTR